MDLTNCPLFEDVSPEEIDQILHCFCSNTRHLQAGELLNCSDIVGKIGVLLAGEAKIIRIDYVGSRALMDTLTPGSVFGEALAFANSPLDQMFLECVNSCDLIFFAYTHFTKRCANSCEHHNILLQNLFRLLSKKVLTMASRVEVLSHRSIRAKLLCFFRITAAEAKSTRFTLPFSITALAEYICADRSAMMRELKAMKEEGLLQMDRRQVTLLSVGEEA